MNEIQEVYRLQGVNINDKHLKVISRQMMRGVRVEDIGEHRIPAGSYLRFLALFAVAGFGFLLPFALIIPISWVADGFDTQKAS